MSLPPTDPQDAKDADLAAACEALQHLVKQGQCHAVETVFRQFTGLSNDRDAQLELIYLEYVLRRDTAQPADGESLCQRFPELGEDIRMLMEVDSAVHWSRALTSVESNGHEFDNDTARGLTPPAEALDGLERQFTAAGNPSRLPIDTGFDDYQILEKIGQGGMGLVYRALQRSLNRLVAIKTINIASSFHPALRARFQAEAELSAKLQHPNIVQIYGIGENDGVPYFSMELVQGPNLAEAIAERPLEPTEAARLVATLARAIYHAHTQGVIHRDLKPTNILLAPIDPHDGAEGDLGSRYAPKIADFGLGRFSKSTSQQTCSGAMLGTPSYMAPEQICDPESVGPISDVYSLGAVLYTLLIGSPPFLAASALETLRQVRQEDPTPLRRINSRLPRDLETICLKCLRKEPQARYESAEHLSADLQRFLCNKPIAARPTGAAERTWKWTRRHPSLATLIAALLCSSVILTGLWWRATASQLAEVRQRERVERLSVDREMQHAQREYEASNIDGCQQLLDTCDPAFRHWEWHYLNGLCHQTMWQSPRYPQAAQTTDISRDGRFVATGYGRWGFDAPQTIHVWDLHSQQQVFTLRGHPDCSVQDVNFSPDGKLLLSAAMAWNTNEDSEYGGVILWNLESGKPRLRFPKLNAMIARFHPDGQSFYIGSSQGTVTEHAVADGKLIRTYRGRRREHLNQMILDLHIDFDTQRMAATSRGGDLAIWNLGEPEPEYFMSEMGDLRQIKLLPNEHIMVGSYSGNREWFELGKGQLQSLHRDSVEAIPYTLLSPDGQLQVTTIFGKGVEIRDFRTSKLLRQLNCHLGHVRDMAFDGSGTRLLTCGHDGRTMLWDVTELDSHPKKIAMAGRVGAMIWSPAADEFAFIVEENPARGTRSLGKPRVEIRDPATLRSKTIINLPCIASCIDYTPDGESLLIGLTDHSTQVWRKDGKEPLCGFNGHTADVLDIDTAVGSVNAISIDASGTICKWSPVDGTLIEQHNVTQRIRLADFHPQQSIVAMCVDENQIQLWNYGRQLAVRTLPPMARIQTVQFSYDGQLLGVASEDTIEGQAKPTIELFRVQSLLDGGTDQPLSILTGHLGSITGFSFSPDNQRVVTISDDETVRLFDVGLGCEVHLLNTEKGNDGAVLFGRNGNHILRSRSNELASWGNERTSSDKRKAELPDERNVRLKQWHQSQFNAATRQQQWRAARFHSTAMLELGERQYLYRRALVNLDDNRWQEAEKDIESYLEETDGILPRCLVARIKLKLNKHDEYIEQCRWLCDQLEDPACTDDNANSIAWIVCLSPTFTAPLDRLTERLGKAIKQQKRSTYHNTLALVHIRSGKYDEAISAANLSLKLDRAASAPFDWLFLELCRIRQSQRSDLSALSEAALQELKNASRTIQDKKLAEPYKAQAQAWLEGEEQKAVQKKIVSNSYIQTRHLEIPLFLEELNALTRVDSR